MLKADKENVTAHSDRDKIGHKTSPQDPVTNTMKKTPDFPLRHIESFRKMLKDQGRDRRREKFLLPCKSQKGLLD